MIKTIIHNNYFEIILNRPDVKNALSPEFIDLIIDELKILESRDELNTIVISGVDDIFSAGADLKWLLNNSDDETKNHNESKKFIDLLETIQNLSKFVIANINGHCVGAGTGIALASDISIAKNNVKMGFSEIKVGVIPVAIVDLIFKKMNYSLAKKLILTGERIKSQKALEFGIINDLYKEDLEKEKILKYYIDHFKNISKITIKETKRFLFNYDKIDRSDLQELIIKSIAEMKNNDEIRKKLEKYL